MELSRQHKFVPLHYDSVLHFPVVSTHWFSSCLSGVPGYLAPGFTTTWPVLSLLLFLSFSL